MQSNTSNQASSLSRALCVTWIALSTFAVGYTASRALLSQGVNGGETVNAEVIIPHQATLWDAGLENY